MTGKAGQNSGKQEDTLGHVTFGQTRKQRVGNTGAHLFPSDSAQDSIWVNLFSSLTSAEATNHKDTPRGGACG